MKNTFLKKIIILLVCAAILLPSYVRAESSNLQVNQPVCANVECTDGGGGNDTRQDTSAPSIFDIAVKATYNSAIVSWSTNEISLGKVAWGKNQDYADGEISVEKYLLKQQAQILNLAPQTQYYFRITAIDQAGNTRVYAGKFITLVEPDVTGPQNVTNFTVTPARDRIGLSWVNPPDADLSNVRVVRSQIFFPIDPFNGAVVYEGSEQFVSDGAVVPGNTYYYTIFTKDNTGNYSTGVVGSAMILWYSETDSQYPDAPIVDIQFPQAPDPIENPATFEDFKIIYNHGAASTGGSDPQVPTRTNVKIVVPQSELPVGTHSLLVTIRDGYSQIGEATYLFAFDKTTKEFFVTIPTLLAAQIYQLTITIFNSAHQILQTIGGSMEVVINGVGDLTTDTSPTAFPWFLLLLLLLIAIVLIILRYYYHLEEGSFSEPVPPLKTRAKPKLRSTLRSSSPQTRKTKN